MPRFLDVRTQEGTEVLRLEWKDGRASIVSGSERGRAAAARWIQFGLSEWVGEGADMEPRHTPPSSEKFLSRIKEYLDRQFDFVITLED